jgi:hypothetical protein
VVVVNESYAREHFDRQGPLGRSIRVGQGEEGWHTVVGVVEDFGVEGVGASETPDAAVFLSAAQHPPDRADLLLRVHGDLKAVSDQVVRLVEGEGGLFLSGATGGMADFLARSRDPLKWFGGLALALGLITLGASAFGVHSLATYSVFLRTGEIGLRRALGASRLRVAALVFRRSGAVLLLGIFLGLEGAFLLAAWMQEIAFNRRGFDLWLFVGASAVLAVAAGLGTLVPSRRASRIPPASAMSGA